MRRHVTALLLCICLCLAFPFYAFATTVDAEKDCSLTFVYQDGDLPCQGLSVQTYRIADVSAHGNYTLTEAFSAYPVQLYDVQSQAQWKKIASTLAAYVVADQIPATATAMTDVAGKVQFQNLSPGMYLTLSVTYENILQYVFFENFLTAVPSPNINGTYAYDVTAYPKCEKRQLVEQEIAYKVIKQWQDAGAEANRPAKIEVAIYKNGVFQKTVHLNGQNNWCYGWNAKDDGSVWVAVERNIPAFYDVTVSKSGNTILLTNHYSKPETPPETGDTFSVWPFVLVLCVSGALLVILALLSKRKSK